MDQIVKTVLAWAEHAAGPFHGYSKEQIAPHLKIVIETALGIGGPVVDGVDKVDFAYCWDENDQISVVVDSEKFTNDMLVVKGGKCQ